MRKEQGGELGGKKGGKKACPTLKDLCNVRLVRALAVLKRFVLPTSAREVLRMDAMVDLARDVLINGERELRILAEGEFGSLCRPLDILRGRAFVEACAMRRPVP